MSQKHSQKMGAGSDFYRSQVSRRARRHDRENGPSRDAKGRNPLICSWLSGVRRRRSLLDGRRFVPPGPCG